MLIDESVRRWARRRPAQTALRFPADPGRPSEVWTYGELEACIRRHVQEIDRLVPAGLPVAIMMAAHGNSVAALLAAFRSRRPAVLLPTSLTPIESRELVNMAAVRAVLGISPTGLWDWAAVPLSDSQITLWRRYPQDVAIVQLTSGSTGASRLALRTSAAVGLEVTSVASCLEMGRSDEVVSLSSLAHSYALLGGLLTPLYCGAAVSLAANPGHLTMLAAPYRPSIVFGLAATYKALLERPGVLDTEELRWMFSAGAALPAGLFDEFRERFHCPIRQDYGTTETGTISLDTAEDVASDGAGGILPHLEMRLARAMGAFPLHETVDEVQIRSPAVAVGYLQNEGLRPCVDDAGWFHTRDTGALDLAGHLHLGRRLRDPIDIPGLWAHPEAVEAIVTEVAGVKECIVAAERSRTADYIKIFVAPLGFDEDHVRRAVVKSFPGLEKRIAIVALEELPRSPAGKILQKYLV